MVRRRVVRHRLFTNSYFLISPGRARSSFLSSPFFFLFSFFFPLSQPKLHTRTRAPAQGGRLIQSVGEPCRDEIIIAKHLHYKVVYRAVASGRRKGRKMEQCRGWTGSLGLGVQHCHFIARGQLGRFNLHSRLRPAIASK